MLRTEIAKMLSDRIAKAKKIGSVPEVNETRGAILVYHEYGAITIHETNELLDECLDANIFLIENGARPYVHW